MSSVPSRADRKITGTWAGSARSFRAMLSPSRSGSMMSRITRSGPNSSAARIASRPLATSLVTKPSYRSAVATASVMDGSSSTISTRAGTV